MSDVYAQRAPSRPIAHTHRLCIHVDTLEAVDALLALLLPGGGGGGEGGGGGGGMRPRRASVSAACPREHTIARQLNAASLCQLNASLYQLQHRLAIPAPTSPRYTNW
jgi:hypothetical protein